MELVTALKSRKTEKVLGDPADPVAGGNAERSTLDELLRHAGLAPFHHSASREHLANLSSPVPWRCYKLDRSACRHLMKVLVDQGDSTKIPSMLAAADFLIQVTWLPDQEKSYEGEELVYPGTLRNMEHIAAAAAMTQSLLLAATAAGFRTYWSSGGPLRGKTVFDLLEIPEEEELLGSVFLFPADVSSAEVRPGAMRDRRGNLNDWSKWTEIK